MLDSSLRNDSRKKLRARSFKGADLEGEEPRAQLISNRVLESHERSYHQRYLIGINDLRIILLEIIQRERESERVLVGSRRRDGMISRNSTPYPLTMQQEK